MSKSKDMIQVVFGLKPYYGQCPLDTAEWNNKYSVKKSVQLAMGDWVGTYQLLQILALYTFQILPASKMPNFHLNKMCESLIYLPAEQHHLFLQTKHNKLSGNFKRISDNFEGKMFIFVLGKGSQLNPIRINLLYIESTLSIVIFSISNNPGIHNL